MPSKRPYELDFEQYIRNTEPAKKDKTYAWSTAIGLQQVDGLTPSKYLYDTAKREWVLDGDTVMYGAAFELKMALDYDFEQERNFNYKNLNIEEIVKHITFFVSRLWQIHAFWGGNTRTTALSDVERDFLDSIKDIENKTNKK